MLDLLLRRAVHPLANVGTGFLNEISALKRLQWQHRGDLERLIFKRLRFLVAYAYEHSPSCRERLNAVALRPDEIRSLEDFRRIPTIARSTLSRTLDATITSRSGTLTSTGGTEGSPMFFPVSRDASVAGLASELFFQSWLGVEPFEKKFSSRPYVRVSDRLFLNELEVTSASIIRNPESVYRRLCRFRPRLVGGNAAIRILASYMSENDLQMSERPSAVSAWGMPLLPEQLEMLSKAFCENVYDAYGSAELGGIVAQQCEARTGLHINTELSFVEVLKDGEPCSEGERGKLVVTNLRNLATPIIRYEQGDRAVVLDGCACGRHIPLMAHITGKDPSFIRMKGGVQIPQATLNSIVGHMDESKRLERYFFQMDTANDLLLTIHPKRGFSQRDAEKIRGKLSSTLGALARISVQVLSDSGESN
jgi:phenylacetate-CoA ligase